jgi:hypothetical protein
MAHPFESTLKEYQVAIDHLAATVPPQVKKEAQQMHDALLANANATEEDIRAAMLKTGLAEYPHRHAYKELVGNVSEARRVEMILEHVDEKVRGKLKTLLDSGVPLEEITRSAMFETDFSADERYQVEDAILDAADHLKEEFSDAAGQNKKEYEVLVKKWTEQEKKIEEKIAQLETLKDKDAKWRDEIARRVARLREGFLVTEPDPELLEVEKEIEYWHGTLGEEV